MFTFESEVLIKLAELSVKEQVLWENATPQKIFSANHLTIQFTFELSHYVMIDLGGRDRSRQHAENTAGVLNL